MMTLVLKTAPVSAVRQARIAYVTFNTKREVAKLLADITRFQTHFSSVMISPKGLLDIRDSKRKYMLLQEELRTARCLADARRLVETNHTLRFTELHNLASMYAKLDHLDNHGIGG